MKRIVLFGEPAAGKTTIAQRLAQQLRCPVIEASEAVIFPLAAHCKTFPPKNILLEKLAALQNTRCPLIDRQTARNLFIPLKQHYSPHFIAKALHTLYVGKTHGDHLIFSGVRGLPNAKYCRLHNDFVVYLKADHNTLIRRLCKERGYSQQHAIAELAEEQKLFATRNIAAIANVVIDTTSHTIPQTCRQILRTLKNWKQMCKRCVNTTANPAIRLDSKGYCQICRAYQTQFKPQILKRELTFLRSLQGTGNGKHDVLVGLSGGKDSTATLYTIKQMGFTPLAFTFDLGYLPETTIPRAREAARKLKAGYEVINIRSYVRNIDRKAYKKTLALYEQPFTLTTKIKFKKAYATGRKHYSVKCKHSPPFVRTCQLCRRMVIRAYYAEAVKRGIKAVVLGINEWTRLSAAQQGISYPVSGVRKLQPTTRSPAVYVFHLPFLLQRTSKQTKKILDRLGWTPPQGEDFIESNANSCLFARSTERMAKRLLEFHPDSTRLAREVTVGFITKQQALKALGKLHPYHYTPRQVLERAGVL